MNPAWNMKPSISAGRYCCICLIFFDIASSMHLKLHEAVRQSGLVARLRRKREMADINFGMVSIIDSTT